MKRICILGGAFDPIHSGHLGLAQIATKYADEVWVMPCLDHTHDKQMTAFSHRMYMCAIAVLGKRHVFVSDFEQKHHIAGGSMRVVEALGFLYPDVSFSFIIGQDNADTIETWKESEKLRESVSFIVVPRQGYPKTDHRTVWYAKSPHIYLTRDILVEASSTDIREVISMGEQPSHLHEGVWDYVLKNQLYGCCQLA
jgi:nicotinate-nucleotide adenylyltransferase